MSIDDLHVALSELYEHVPRTTCQNTGGCCSLTAAERQTGFATMYPLYEVEHLNILRYVSERFDGERREYLMGFTEEWPRRCPFRDERMKTCTIYPVRPFVCRAYGVLSPDFIAEAARRYAEDLPSSWIQAFVQVQSQIVCPRVRILDREKVEGHIARLITGEYARRLVGLGLKVDTLGEGKRKALAEVIGRSRILRWTWGGYNTLRLASAEWLREHGAEYWKDVRLAD